MKTNKDKEKCWFCGADMKVSKKGNLYCSKICWKTKEYKEEQHKAQLSYDAKMESDHSDWGDR